jgi:predicted peptidase
VDAGRQYLTGLSMGGHGTWEWAHAAPERFAALAPVCGGWRDDATRPAACARLAQIPHYIAHGANDLIVPVARSDAMVEGLR